MYLEDDKIVEFVKGQTIKCVCQGASFGSYQIRFESGDWLGVSSSVDCIKATPYDSKGIKKVL